MTGSELIALENVSIKAGGNTILQHVNLSICKGEQWAIVGNSGSGKTSLANALVGKIFYSGTITYHLNNAQSDTNKIILIEQQHRFKNLSNTSDFYYQQRFNSSDAENSLTVEEVLKEHSDNEATKETLAKWIELLHLDPLLKEPLIQLSNGENKRLQLAEALLSDPAVLIMDNPFLGLDVEGRKTLRNIIDSIVEKGIHLVLITSDNELPESITHVAILANATIKPLTKQEYLSFQKKPDKKPSFVFPRDLLAQIGETPSWDFETAIRMINVSVKYGGKAILENINWEVKRGDCWSLSGPNGAGKSTLLSLITADNPQAYANEIYLFDKRKGRGESIWDIKKRIGYVSPELHLFFEQHSNCFQVIASGLFDTIGLFRQLSVEQEEIVSSWLELLSLQKQKLKLLSQLSLGEQRMILLARALVKNPPLLILDEPCQGLDDVQSAYFKTFIDQLCTQFGTTLLYVSHYEKDIPSCVNKYIRLEKGKQV